MKASSPTSPSGALSARQWARSSCSRYSRCLFRLGAAKQVAGLQPAAIALQVPLAGMMFPDNRLLIALGVLMTYEHMGYARIDCTFGCVCPPRELNTLHPFKWGSPLVLLSHNRNINISQQQEHERDCVQVLNDILEAHERDAGARQHGVQPGRHQQRKDEIQRTQAQGYLGDDLGGTRICGIVDLLIDKTAISERFISRVPDHFMVAVRLR